MSRRWRDRLIGVAAVVGVLLGVLGFDRLVARTQEPATDRLEAAQSYLDSQGKNFRLTECRTSVTDDSTVNCGAATDSGRVVRLRFGFRPDGTVGGMCEIGTKGCGPRP